MESLIKRIEELDEMVYKKKNHQSEEDIQSEKIINECLQHILSTTDPEKSIRQILAYMGKMFSCDRVYVFEFEDAVTHNTYEWCEQGVSEQRDILQNLSVGNIDWWMQYFREKKEVMIQDLEEICTEYPALYAILKPQNIQRLAVVGMSGGEHLIGFLGVDNPDVKKMKKMASLMRVVSYFIVSLLRYRDLLRRIEEMKFQDTLTGAFNRTAMFQHFSQMNSLSSAAIIYCDITELKQNNGTLGSVAGDQLLRSSYAFICQKLETVSVYRVSGDEFAVVFPNISEASFMKKVKAFQNQIEFAGVGMVIGYAWSDELPVNLDDLLSRADKVLCKKMYGHYIQESKIGTGQKICKTKADNGFYQFLKKCYYDPEQMFRSISQENTTSYFFFGDMQQDLFYISDNLKEEFGFQSNIVPKFLTAWEYRIVSKKSRELYRKDQEAMLREKRSVHDLRYQVKDIEGKSIWIHCYGILKWNEDQSEPVFFSGRITHQDRDFVVDSVTNFPRTSVMLRRLNEMEGEGETRRTIGFSLNNITEINNTKGRAYADRLVQMIAEELINEFSSKMSLYRLDGMRCMAIIDDSCTETKEELITKMKKVISKWYRLMGISVHQSCSFAFMEYDPSAVVPADFLEQMVSLIKVAKHDSNALYEQYSGDSIRKVKRMSKLSLALSHDVMHGMKNFRIVIQPVVSAKDGKIMGGEALLRWKFGEEMVPPSIFIPMLEKTSMIYTVGRWIFEQVVCVCMRMHVYQEEFHLAFNVSLQQLDDPGFTEDMQEILSKYQMDGKYLIAEMTENCMDKQPEKMFHFVEQCKKMGMKIALDDFGNGYSSLRRLLQYPSNIIKLDRSLLGEMMESEKKKNFISSIVYACHRFGKKVCMEGVETAEQNQMIQEAECDMIQGYYYYRPMEVEEMYQLLSRS